MKIVQVTTATDTGGVLTHVLDLAEQLIRRGHEVLVALPEEASRPRLLAERRGLRAITTVEARDVSCDVWHLHSHSTFDRATLRLHAARRLRRGPIVLTEHLPRAAVSDPAVPWGPDATGHPRRGAATAKTFVKRAQLLGSSAVIVVSSSSKEFMLRRYGIARDAVDVIYNGVHTPPRPGGTELSDTEPLRVVAVGALGWRKGFDVLIEAVSIARQPLRVDIIGDGPLRTELEALAAPVADRVRFLGFCADAADRMSDYDVFCLPTRGEAFPYVTLEAMARERAVVASDVDGVGELIDHGRNGLLVRAEDARELAGALDTLALDRDLGRRLAHNARIDVAGRFGVERMVDQTVEVYRRVGRG